MSSFIPITLLFQLYFYGVPLGVISPFSRECTKNALSCVYNSSILKSFMAPKDVSLPHSSI